MSKITPMEPRYYRSPVDYEAWRNGYLPPSEHVLIHELSVGNVKVLASTQCDNWGWWLVVRGDMDQDDYEEIQAIISRALQRKFKSDQKRKEEAEQIEAEQATVSPDKAGKK